MLGRGAARRPRAAVVAIALLAGVITFVGAVQVRSQAEVVRTLSGQDNTALAFLIDDLHRANDSLAAQRQQLEAQRDALRGAGSQGAGSQLAAESRDLEVVEGLVPVTGPGVVLTIDAPLGATDLQDAVNNLRQSGAEAIQIDSSRVITGTVIASVGGQVTIDGTPVRGPWTLVVIGDPNQLAVAADLMTSSLRADPRVRQAAYRSAADLRIAAVVSQRPFVYGSS